MHSPSSRPSPPPPSLSRRPPLAPPRAALPSAPLSCTRVQLPSIRAAMEALRSTVQQHQLSPSPSSGGSQEGGISQAGAQTQRPQQLHEPPRFSQRPLRPLQPQQQAQPQWQEEEDEEAAAAAAAATTGEAEEGEDEDEEMLPPPPRIYSASSSGSRGGGSSGGGSGGSGGSSSSAGFHPSSMPLELDRLATNPMMQPVLRGATETARRVDAELHERECALAKEQGHARAADAEVSRQRDEIEHIKTESWRKSSEYDNARSKLEGQLRQYESDLVQARSQCADLQKERQQLEADMQQLRELNTSHAAKVQSQATRIETLEQEQCKSQKEQAELHAQLRSGQAELAQLQQTTRALEEQLQRDHAAAADKLSSTIAELQQAQSDIERLSTECQRLRFSLAAEESRASVQTQLVRRQSSELNELRQQRDDGEQRHAEARDGFGALNDELARTKSLLAAEREAKVALEGLQDSTVAEVSRRAVQCLQLQQENNELRAKLIASEAIVAAASARVSSDAMVGHSPLVHGGAGLLGFTAAGPSFDREERKSSQQLRAMEDDEEDVAMAQAYETEREERIERAMQRAKHIQLRAPPLSIAALMAGQKQQQPRRPKRQ